MTSTVPRTNARRLVALVVVFLIKTIQVHSQIPENVEFSPTVTGKCDRGEMTILVTTDFPFHGIVHIRGFRQSPCVAYGNGLRNITLKLSLLTDHDDPNYCGVEKGRGGGSQAKSVVVAVRAHEKLEISDDKFYLITCGKSGFVNARNELSQVHLNFMEDYKKVNELFVGRQYVLRAGLSQGKDFNDITVKDCYGFGSNTTEVKLIDSEGCSKTNFLSKFRFNKTAQAADAVLFSTFKFPNTQKVHLQCDIILCKRSCPQFRCQQNGEALRQPLPQSQGQEDENVQLLASTTVFVLEPGQDVTAVAVTNCTEWQFPWLIGLCICLAILLLIMLIVNIFLCSSLTCSCTKTEVVDKEPSEMEDYDPYRVGWASSSHYGSRTSLNKPYMSGGSTMNSIPHSIGSGSDHYAIVHSRPNSRYSHHSSRDHLHQGPGSTISNGQYSSRM